MAAPKLNQFGRTHGLTGTATYATWAQLVQRCTNPRLLHKPRRYIDRRWLVFENFLHDMGQRPPGYVLRLLAGAAIYGPTTAFWRPRDEPQCGAGRTSPADWPALDADRCKLL